MDEVEQLGGIVAEVHPKKVVAAIASKIEPKHVRFSELSWYDPSFEILIGGCGGIGSWLSMFLGRAGYTLYLFDDDTIDETNMGGQLYSLKDIGVNKAQAMQNHIKNFSNNSKVELMGRYEIDSPANPITFSCFDNMGARKMLFENWCKQEDRSIFIDGRMLAEGLQIYSVVKGNEEAYKATLFDDKEVEEQPCSAKATSHCGAIIGGLMMSVLTNHIANIKLDLYHRDVPFKITLDIPLINFKAE